MKREEIRERAERIVADLDRMFILGSGRYEEVTEGHVASIVRATLEEATRAVCQGCCEMNYDPITQDHRHQINDNGDFEGGPCYAIAIHDLIAALDAKADAAPTEES